MGQITQHPDPVVLRRLPSPASTVESDRRLEPKVAIGMFVLVAAVRFAYAANRTTLSTFPDEAAQLAIARRLSGGTPWSLFDHSTWQPGFSVLIVPAFWVSESTEVVYRIALATNSALGGIAAVLLAALLIRVTPIDVRSAAWISVVIALLPAGLAASARTWAEPLVTVIVLALLIVAQRAVEEVSPALGTVAVVLAGAGYLVHGRLLPLIPSAFGVLAFALWRRRRTMWIAPAVVGTAVMFGAIEWFSTWVERLVWTDPDQTNTVRATLGRIAQPGALVDSIVGQVWYVLVASALFAGLGVWSLVRSVIGAPGELAVGRRSDASVLLGVIAPLVAVSMLFMAGRSRPDMLIYGRYNEAVLWPVVAIGVVWLILALRAGRRADIAKRLAVTATVGVVSTVFVALRSGDQLREPGVVRLMISGVAVFADPRSAAFAWLACALSLVVAALIVMALGRAGRASVMGAFVIGALVVGLGVRSWAQLGRNLNSFADVANVREVTDLLPPGEPVGFHFVPVDEPSVVLYSTQRRLAQLYQWYLPDHRIDVDVSVDDDVGPFVFAPKDHEPLAGAGAEMIWLDERTGMALWLEP